MNVTLPTPPGGLSPLAFLEAAQSYYHYETRGGGLGSALGLVLLLTGLGVWRWASPAAWFSGMGLPFVGVGLLLLVAGAWSYQESAAEARALNVATVASPAWLHAEYQRVEDIHGGWARNRAIWTGIGLLGVLGLVVGALGRPYFVGVGVGLLLLGAMGHWIEWVSMRRNEAYRTLVRQQVSALGHTPQNPSSIEPGSPAGR